MALSKNDVLQQYGVSPAALISSGMEAEVYAVNDQTVLKLYRGSEHLASLGVLMDFYQSLERESLPYRLPCIQSLAVAGEFCVTLENRLPGVTMASLLPGLTAVEMDTVMVQYIDAVLALSRLPIPVGFNRHLLFDAEGFSSTAKGDWNAFLRAFLQHRLHSSAACLRREVRGWDGKLRRIEHLLAQPYTGELRVVHGDFFPGNLLVYARLPKSPKTSEVYRVCALLDFGLFTMLGDPLFDLATAWVFFDMYDDLKINTRARLLTHIIDRLGEGIRGRLYRYVLIYSLLSANTYAPDCSDGHYRWCVENLNNEIYWTELA